MARNGVVSTQERAQAMAPGAYCVAPITIRNTSNRALDAWLRIRVFRATAFTAIGSPTERMSDKLRFYIHEYSGGTLSGQHLGTNVYESGTTEQARDLDCTTATYKPSTFTSAARIASDTGGTNVQSRVPTAPTNVVRTALTSITDAGLAFGNGGLGLLDGPGGPPTTTNTVTNLASNRNAVNIVGSDEVNDPLGAVQVPAKAATNAAGTQLESLITGGSVKLYCMAVFWPDDTDLSQGNANLTAANTLGDNLLALGSLSYYLTVDAAQRSGR
jgi:hypothetical protein